MYIYKHTYACDWMVRDHEAAEFFLKIHTFVHAHVTARVYFVYAYICIRTYIYMQCECPTMKSTIFPAISHIVLSSIYIHSICPTWIHTLHIYIATHLFVHAKHQNAETHKRKRCLQTIWSTLNIALPHSYIYTYTYRYIHIYRYIHT